MPQFTPQGLKRRRCFYSVQVDTAGKSGLAGPTHICQAPSPFRQHGLVVSSPNWLSPIDLQLHAGILWLRGQRPELTPKVSHDTLSARVFAGSFPASGHRERGNDGQTSILRIDSRPSSGLDALIAQSLLANVISGRVRNAAR